MNCLNHAPATDGLSAAILQALSDAPEGLSLPRLGKRLGLGASVVLRRVQMLSDAKIGGWAGPAWVRVTAEDGRWRVYPTEAGLLAHGLPGRPEGIDVEIKPDART